MRDILDILKAETSKFPGAHSRMIVSTGMQVLTRARDEIEQLRAKLKTSRADAMEECAVAISEVPIGYQTKAELAKLQDHVDWCAKAIRDRAAKEKDNATT